MNNLWQKLAQKTGFHLILIFLILFALGWATISPLVFSTSDAGLRFLQIRSLIAERWHTLAIAYPTEVDPTFRYAPYYYAYSLVNGRLYFNISPFYPLIASFLYAGFSKAGLAVSPIIGSLLTAWGTVKLAKTAKLPRPNLMMWAAIFATPLLFYSVQVWDHTLGTGLATLGIAFALDGLQKEKRGAIFVGGMILGLSLGQRPELYVLVGAAGAAWLLINWRNLQRTIPLIIGGLTGALPLFILQQLWVGHPLGMATAANLWGYGRPDSYLAQTLFGGELPRSIIAGNFLFHIDSHDAATFSAALATIIGIGLFFFALRIPRYQKKAVLWIATLLILTGTLIWSIIARHNMVTGLISTFPLFGISIVYVSEDEHNQSTHKTYRIIFIICAIYLFAMLTFWPTFGARVWGARYLLTAYPLLLFLAFYNLAAYRSRFPPSLQKTLLTAFTVLVIASTGLQFLGYRFNQTIVTSLVADRDAAAASPVDVILTNHPFWPALIGPLADKEYYYVKSDADLAYLIPRLYEANARSFTIILLESDQLTMPTQLDDIVITQSSPFMFQMTKTDN